MRVRRGNLKPPPSPGDRGAIASSVQVCQSKSHARYHSKKFRFMVKIDRKLDDNESKLGVVPLSDLGMDVGLSEIPIEKLLGDNRESVEDEIHEDFVEETREKLPEEKLLDMETDIGKELDVDMGSPICTSDVPMSVHLDYCSEQLHKFHMLESDEEEEDVTPEMQCVAKEISAALGSTKISLLDTLKKEVGQKKKINTSKDGRWGRVLSNKP
ncbi:hypothetical protein D1007_39090 [Hordeum vulgare]|nr:hypothetical protein D1007_39090 [Hordeum vulgare]